MEKQEPFSLPAQSKELIQLCPAVLLGQLRLVSGTACTSTIRPGRALSACERARLENCERDKGVSLLN